MAAKNFILASGLLASKVFDLTDQQRFAQFSGDFNLMHLDALGARKTQAGRVVVHGMHQLLWAIEELAPHLPCGAFPGVLRARFPRFLFLDEEASLSAVQQDDDMLRLSITAKGVVVANIAAYLSFGQPPKTVRPPASTRRENPEPGICQQLAFEDMDGLSGDVSSWSAAGDAQQYFPAASKLIGEARVNAIATLSRMVGMVCPGLHSMFSAVDIRLVDIEQEDRVHFSVASIDRRFSHVEQKVSGAGIEGSVQAFMRQPPAAQKSVSEAARFVARDEFADTVALVVGASRGLGEFAAKLIAAGGGHVIATYAVGRAECEELAREIRAFGGRCDILAYDARRPAAEQLRSLPAVPTSVYYFATTKIFQRAGQLYESERFLEFMQIYVDGFYDLCCCLRPKDGGRLSVVYPSSVYVEARPVEMTAYAMAKAAGEILCSDMSRSWPGMNVLSPRLPRLATDQTASISLLDRDTPLVSEVLLPIVRQAERRPLKEQCFS